MNLQIKIISLLLLIFLLVACTSPVQPTTTIQPTAAGEPSQTPEASRAAESFPWWNETVFYEVFVRSFRDSDGDGIGDFNGITDRLDYLQKLGIRGLWLMPINPSPSYHGYDVTDYYAVNPDYGTLEDFKRLLDEAHQRDIKIIMDLVLNHTSSQHPWFQAALTPGSEYHDWYKWSETDPHTPGPWGQDTWHEASNGQYYYAIFWDQMPDLNYENDAVQEEAKKIASFWLQDVGVDGFRLDAVRYLAEGEALQDSPSNHAYLEEWGEYYRSIAPQAFTVGEAWTDHINVRKYVETDRELDSAFNFDLSTAILSSLNTGSNAAVRFAIRNTLKSFPEQDNANFLTNHDMPRVMNQFVGDEGKAKAAAAILLTLPGTPFLYYGEEIGMNGAKPDELIRTPMQWTGEPGAGFTEGTPWEPINADFTTINVAAQTGKPASLLEHYRRLIQLRNAHSALRTGEMQMVEAKPNKLLAYLRVDEEETFLILINVDDIPVTKYELKLRTGPLSGKYSAASLLEDAAFDPLQANEKGGFDAYAPLEEIAPYGVSVIQLTSQK